MAKKELSDKTMKVIGAGLAITGMVVGAIGGAIDKKMTTRHIDDEIDRKVTEKMKILISAAQNNSEG